jgi:hypothetical protein
MEKPTRFKPGPKANAKLRHKMAALYFCSIANEEGWTLERISKLCEALYGVGVTPDQIARWAEVHRKAAKKLKEEFRTTNDLMVC